MNTELSTSLTNVCTRESWVLVPHCVDYKCYLIPIKNLTFSKRKHLIDNLAVVGYPQSENCGVTYIIGNWGFAVIPPQNFPELKINFYKKTSTHQIAALKCLLIHIIGMADLAMMVYG